METALHSVTDKFKRHLNLLKPVLELLLRETSANPSASMLRRMLAFRKSLAAFEMSVTQVRRCTSFPSHHAERFCHVLFWEFPCPAWAVASCSSGPLARGTL